MNIRPFINILFLSSTEPTVSTAVLTYYNNKFVLSFSFRREFFFLCSIRILPHKQDTGGFFVAVLVKKSTLKDAMNRQAAQGKEMQICLLKLNSLVLPPQVFSLQQLWQHLADRNCRHPLLCRTLANLTL